MRVCFVMYMYVVLVVIMKNVKCSNDESVQNDESLSRPGTNERRAKKVRRDVI